MATSGSAFAISLAIYFAVLVGIFIGFSVWRRLRFTKRFYAPKKYGHDREHGLGHERPPKLRKSFGGWVPGVIGASEDELVRSAGVDATLYIKVLRMGFELFVGVSLIVLVIILPINLTSGQVSQLMATDSATDPTQVSPYTYWVPPPPPPGTASSDKEPEPVSAPPIYNTSIPDPPAGIIWWAYLPGVPPLPPPPPGISGWKYDDKYTTVSYEFSDLDKTTMSNVPSRSTRLYAHAIISWVVTAYALWLFWRYCREALRLRMFALLNSPPGADSHTVLCTDIPGVAAGTIPARLDGTLLKLVPKQVKRGAYGKLAKLRTHTAAKLVAKRSTRQNMGASDFVGVEVEAVDLEAGAGGPSPGVNRANNPAYARAPGEVESLAGWAPPDRWDDACDAVNAAGGDAQVVVERQFRFIYKDDLASAHLVYNTSALDPLLSQYNSFKANAITAVDDVLVRRRAGKKVKPQKRLAMGARLGAWGREKYGVKPHKVEAWQYYEDVLTHLHEAIHQEQGSAKGHAYPSAFVSFHRRTSQVVAANALMCEDLTAWRCQAAPRPDEIIWGNLGMRTWERSARSTLMWVAFWLLVAFYIIPVTAVQALLSTNSLVSFINKIPIINSLVTAILPSLALKIFLALLPLIIKSMNRFAGMVSVSQVDQGLLSRYFIFQVITVFFGSFIAGTFANQFQQLIDDPGSIVTILGTAAPQTAIFFMSYLLLQALLTTPLSLLRIVPFIIFWLRTRLASTPRRRAALTAPVIVEYGTLVPDDTIAVLLGLTFCIICPLIAPIAVLYFATAYIVQKYQAMYVYGEGYQSGGQAWLRVFNQLVTGLVIFQVTMIGLLGIKKMVAPSIIVVPLPFITIAFSVIAHSTFWPSMRTLSLLAAAEHDAREGAAGAGTCSGEPAPGDSSGGSGLDGDAAQRYVSPAFKLDEEEHAKLLAQLRAAAAAEAFGDYSALEALDDDKDGDGIKDEEESGDEREGGQRNEFPADGTPVVLPPLAPPPPPAAPMAAGLAPQAHETKEL